MNTYIIEGGIGKQVAFTAIIDALVKSEETDKKHRYEQHLHLPDGTGPIDAPSNIVRY